MKHFANKNKAILVFLLVIFALSAQSQIVGVVNYHEDPTNPLPDVTLELYDQNNNLVASTITNNIGEFSFSGIPVGDYSLISTTSLPVGEVDLIDASLILYYLIGWYTFNDYEFAAADVNGSGNVTFGDYILVLISYLMQGNPFPTDEWQFAEVQISVTSSRDTASPAMVWGTSTGDVEGVWLPGSRELKYVEVNEQDITLLNEKEVELNIGSNYDNLISGFNLNMVYPTNLIEVTDVIGPDENFHFNLDAETGTLKVIWLDESNDPGRTFLGETLFRVKVKQLDNSATSEEGLFSLLEGGMVLDAKSNPVEDIQIEVPKIITSASSNLSLDMIAYPNPAVNNLNIKLTSPTEGEADIEVYNLNGQLVKVINTSVFRGTQLINLETGSLPTGQYLYKITIGNKNLHGRFQKSN